MKINLFNEIHSCYFMALYHILKEAGNRRLSSEELKALILKQSRVYGFPYITGKEIREHIELGFKEDANEVKDAWTFFWKDRDKLVSEMQNISKFPLTTAEKMWLKSVYADPRIKLFLDEEIRLPDLSDVEPLFDLDDYVLFDQYSDGDPFLDEHYIKMFRTILDGVRHHVRLEISFIKKNNKMKYNNDGSVAMMDNKKIGKIIIDPEHLEYSERDDKFQLIGHNDTERSLIINVASVVDCKETKGYTLPNKDVGGLNEDNPSIKSLIIELMDADNLLERFLLTFSHYEKETYCIGYKDKGHIVETERKREIKKQSKIKIEYFEDEEDLGNISPSEGDHDEKGEIEKTQYRVVIWYDETDETDLLIRILSFGADIKVIGPDGFVELIRDRLKKQRQLIRR